MMNKDDNTPTFIKLGVTYEAHRDATQAAIDALSETDESIRILDGLFSIVDTELTD